MKFSDDFINNIKAEANRIFVQIVSGYTPLTAKRPFDYWGKSPFTNEKTPSFHIRDDHKMFKCFSTGKAGDVITFIQEVNGISFQAAIIQLSSLLNIDIPDSDDTDRIAVNNILDYNQKIQNKIKTNDSKYLQQRINTPDYDFSIWGEGFADSFIPKTELGIKAGLFSPDPKIEDSIIANRITFPIFNMHGKIIAFTGRTQETGKKVQKWINSHNSIVFEKKKTLYGLHIAKNHITNESGVIAVEGYLDCIAQHSIGLKNTVATMGAFISIEQARTLRIFTDKIILYLDGDSAGQKGALQSIPNLLHTGFKTIIIRVIIEADKDPSDFPDYVDVAWYDYIINDLPKQTAEEEIESTKLFQTKYLNILDPISANVYAKYITDKYGFKFLPYNESIPIIENTQNDLEESIIAKMILEKDSYIELLDILKPNSFSVQANNIIYDTIYNMVEQSIPIDKLTIIEMLYQSGKLQEIGGHEYINRLTSNFASGANTSHYARIVSQKAMKRELASICEATMNDANKPDIDPFELLEKTNENIRAITNKRVNKAYYQMPELIRQTLEQIDKASKSESGISGIKTGLIDFDKLLNGLSPGQLIIIAARPAMGKTAWLISVSLNIALNKIPAGIFSMEMTAVEFSIRYLSALSEINSNQLKTGSLSDMQWNDLLYHCDTIHKLPIYIDDSSGISILDLKTRARKLKQEMGIQILFIDYLQLIRGTGNKTREQEISDVSRQLKELAKELGIPVVALAQLSRSVESRGGDKRPMLSDIRESGGIEQDADVVAFLYRPEYYGILTDESGESTIGIAEMIVAKQRSGGLGNPKLKFDGAISKFSNVTF